MSDKLIETINGVKLKHRTSLYLDEWCNGNYYKKQDEICDRILRGEDPNFKDTIERVHIDNITVEEFIEKYEKGSRPVII